MLRMLLIAMVAGLALSLNPALACDQDGKTGFLPENNLWIDETHISENGMTEKLFDDMIDQLQDLYGPIVKEKGYNLIINGDWKDGTVNAYARKDGKNWYVQMFGGLARHEAVIPDAFGLVLCHEIGHHIGGAPIMGYPGGVWYANEGQADYFGTMKCMRRWMETQDKKKVEEAAEVPAIVKKACATSFELEADRAYCERGSMAGHSLGMLFFHLRKMKVPPAFDTPDPNVVKKTDNAHPAPQCRVDTYFAGAICPVDYEKDVSEKDYRINTCTTEAGAKFGTRPLCWFKPGDASLGQLPKGNVVY